MTTTRPTHPVRQPLAALLMSLAALTQLPAQAQAQPQPHPLPQPAAPAGPAPVAPVAPTAVPAAPAAPAAPALPAEPGRIYTPGPFDRVELAGAARVTLIQGDKDLVFVAGDSDVQRNVEVELSDRQLVVRPGGGWKFWNSSRVNVYIEMRQLNQLTISGASDVLAPGPLNVDRLRLFISGAGQARLEQLQARELVFVISGSGDGQISGQANNMVLQISGKGKVIADRLQTKRARVNVSGLGNVVLWATDELAANISGVGSIDYFGQPQVQRSLSGMGTITARGDRR